MKKTGVLLCLVLTSILLLGLGTASSAEGWRHFQLEDASDFALFDGTNPANQPFSGVVCFSSQPFTFYVTVANLSDQSGEVRITYKDGDAIRFPLAPGASFAFAQAAGHSKTSPDRAVRLSNGGSAAQLSGAMSAIGDGHPICVSCDADSAGGAVCDKIIPTN